MLSLVLFALVTVDVPPEARGANSGGYCTWCSIAALARTHHIAPASDIAREVWDKTGKAPAYAGYTTRVIEELDARGVRYLCHPDGTYDRYSVSRYADTHGAVCTLMRGNPHSVGCHSVVVTRYDADPAGVVEFWDSSNPATPKYTYSRAWFDRWWSGNSVVLLGAR